MDTGTTFRASSNTLGFANYFASGTGEDNAGTEKTLCSPSSPLSPLSALSSPSTLKNKRNESVTQCEAPNLSLSLQNSRNLCTPCLVEHLCDIEQAQKLAALAASSKMKSSYLLRLTRLLARTMRLGQYKIEYMTNF